MGAGVSSAIEGSGAHQEMALGELPESCVAEVMLYLDAAEVCRFARLSRAFRGAAAADFVWETKLPRNYKYLIAKTDSLIENMTKKEIFARLCRRNLFDGGTKEFWMEMKRGGICLSISSKALAITGIDDRRYWNFIPTEESRIRTVAYLQQIWWLEVTGEVDFCLPPGTYSLYFRLHMGRPMKRLGRRVCNLEHVHGWDVKPVKFKLHTSDGQHATAECYLNEPGCWNRHHVGDFVVNKSSSLLTTKVKFSMTQIDCTHTKGGLCVDSVLILPKGFRQDKAFRSYV